MPFIADRVDEIYLCGSAAHPASRINRITWKIRDSRAKTRMGSKRDGHLWSRKSHELASIALIAVVYQVIGGIVSFKIRMDSNTVPRSGPATAASTLKTRGTMPGRREADARRARRDRPRQRPRRAQDYLQQRKRRGTGPRLDHRRARRLGVTRKLQADGDAPNNARRTKQDVRNARRRCTSTCDDAAKEQQHAQE